LSSAVAELGCPPHDGATSIFAPGLAVPHKLTSLSRCNTMPSPRIGESLMSACAALARAAAMATTTSARAEEEGLFAGHEFM
jgi:hypothetical protein